MDQLGCCVANRTRSMRGRSATSGLKAEKRKRLDEDEVIFLGKSLSDGAAEGIVSVKIESRSRVSSSSSSGGALKGKRVAESDFVYLGECKDNPIVIELDDSDDDTEGLRLSYEDKKFEVHGVKEEEKSEGSRRCGEFVDKVENFGNDDLGYQPECPITFTIGSEEDYESERDLLGMDGSSAGDEYDFLSSSTESEDEETSDEDFEVDDDEFEDSISEDSSSSSYDDDDNERKNTREIYSKMVKERVRKVESESHGVCKKKCGRKYKQVEEEEEEELENTPLSVINNKGGEQDHEQWIGADCASVTSNESKISMEEGKDVEDKHEAKRIGIETSKESKKTQNAAEKHEAKRIGIETSKESKKAQNAAEKHEAKRIGIETSNESNKAQNAAEKDEAKRVGKAVDVNADVEVKAFGDNKKHSSLGCSASTPSGEGKLKDKKKRNSYYEGVSQREESGDSAKDEWRKVLRPYKTKEQNLLKLFAEWFWDKHGSDKDDLDGFMKEMDEDFHQRETQPSACREKLPFKSIFQKPGPIEKSESEKELDRLWEEMEMCLKLSEIDFQVGNIGTNEARQYTEIPASLCQHNLFLDEEIGIYCTKCGWVAIEIKDVTPPFVESERSNKRVSYGEVKTSHFDESQFKASGGDSEGVWSNKEGTVWDLIPEVRHTLYPHQQEGFEFIWTNMAGTIHLHKLKNVDPCNEGGCIVSHAPGTGKTRLTMVFLQTYLQVFPKCLPIIIAPANLLLTWEDELRKWNIGIPFHNFNNLELSGKEQVGVANDVDWSKNAKQNKDAIRLVKLYSWFKEKSILLISYSLYEKLAGGKSEVDEEKEKKTKKKKEKKRARAREGIENAMGKVLRDYPGLLVLDEGHTPRNQRSCIWKVLSESRTQKRILLSGTPFQNNFLELYNILCLMKPSFPDSIPQELKKFCQSRLKREKKESKDVNWEPISSGNPADEKINQLKLLMDPFVHVHKGSILQKNLPGLRDCVLTLKPDCFQNETLGNIECSQNILNFEHKLALVSVHPSLFLKCSLTEKEDSVVDKDQLEKLRLNPYAGVKTKFLMELVRMCEAVNEKVLIFSQYIDTLCLIKDQLKSTFNWFEGKEVLYMYGKLDQKQKQFLIHQFNDTNSAAKILLASIKACSEGINLTGASRVVLLDVVWNPSVERQAICRAYRLGQKRVVYTYHLLTQGTTECTKYGKQAEKDRLSELVFSDRNIENDKPKNCAKILEDTILDKIVQHEKLKDMFGECVVQPKEKDLECFGP